MGRKRIKTDVVVYDGLYESLGTEHDMTVMRRIFNFTGTHIIVTEQAGFTYTVPSSQTHIKEYVGCVVVEYSYSDKVSRMAEVRENGMARDRTLDGEPGKDVVRALCDTPVNARNTGYNTTIQHRVQPKDLVPQQPVVLDDLGLMIELQGRPDKAHPDNSRYQAQVLEAIQADGHEPAKVSFYMQAKLIDPENEVNRVFVNFRNDAYEIQRTRDVSTNLAEGLYMTFITIDNLGREQKHTKEYRLDELTHENGFYESRRLALNKGSLDIEKRELDLKALERRAQLDEETHRLKRDEIRDKQRARVKNANERFNDNMDKLSKQGEESSKEDRERFNTRVRSFGENIKNIAMILTSIVGIIKFFGIFKPSPG